MPGRVLRPGACGVLGKAPGAGDFLRLNLSAPIATALDAWLEAGFAALEAEDADWRDAFAEAPAWRLFAEPGVVGAEPLTGVIRPSLDAAGRRFPLAALASPAGLTCEQALATPAWFDAVEAALAAAAAGETSPADLASALATLGPPPRAPSEGLVVRTRTTADGLFLDVEGGADARAEALAAAVETARLPPSASLWWRHAGGRTRLIATEGLPAGRAFAALFQGRARARAAPEPLQASAA